MESSHLLDWAQRCKLGGMTALAVGVWLEVVLLAWGGAGVLVVAFVLSGVGKTIHYGELPLSERTRAMLIGSWVVLSTVVVAFLYTFLQARLGGGGSNFWPLAIASGGLAAVHFGLQHQHLHGLDTQETEAVDAGPS
jgi:hypothetical protein